MAQIIKRTTASGQSRYDVRTRINGRVATRTFKRRKDADAYATTLDSDRLRGVVIDPRRAEVILRTFATGYLKERHDLGVRTADKYDGLLKLHILPELGDLPLNKITPSTVRAWNAGIARRLPSTAAGAYRLLSMMMRSAVADEIITRNPCQVKGASVEKAPERPIATVAEVEALVDAMTDKLRVAVLLSAWCQLRRGELLGLRRRDVDLLRRVLTVALTRGPRRDGTELVKPPKTEAGRRTIALPANIVPNLKYHLSAYVDPGPDSWVIDVQPRTLDRAWVAARKAIGRSDLHLHDLRHTGLTLAAATGATTAELMHRAGHASPAAALRYQHATEDRDKALAAALSKLAVPAKVVPIGTRNGHAMDSGD